MSLELAVQYISFPFAILAFSYAFNQRGTYFIIPEGIYIGAVAAHSFLMIYRSIRATAIDFILAGQVILIIPVVIGFLAFSRLTKYRWLARFPVALLSGAGVGAVWALSIRGQFLGPIADTVSGLMNLAYDPFSRAIFVLLCIPVLSMCLYSRFFSGTAYEKTGRLYYLYRFGRIAFMVLVAYQLGYGGATRLFQSVFKPTIDNIIRLFLGT